MDLDATGDGTRTARAFADFLGTLDQQVARDARGPSAGPGEPVENLSVRVERPAAANSRAGDCPPRGP